MLRTLSMVLIHDIVEIDAGDTYAYDPVGRQTQRQRETEAADRLFGLLPEDQCRRLRDLWEEFEAGQTPEAAFAHAMDNLQPTMLNAAAGGRSWLEHSTCLSSILERHEGTKRGSQTLWEFLSLIHISFRGWGPWARPSPPTCPNASVWCWSI